jgi:hypothetical protein
MTFAIRRRGIVFVGLLALAACSGDDNSGPGTTDLSGTYTMLSLQQGDVTMAPPFASGSLVMTATTYNITVTVQGQVAIADNGTYTISGNQITQTSNVQPIQSVGTWSRSGNVYSIDVTAAGQRVISSWQKQ